MRTLNKALKLLRQYHSLTQKDLAKSLKISSSFLSEIEAGKKFPNFSVLLRYSNFFGLNLSSIFIIEEKMRGIECLDSNRINAILSWKKDIEYVVPKTNTP